MIQPLQKPSSILRKLPGFSRAQKKALEAHYAHLIVHGALHAQGWDHERAADAKKMEAREVEVLVVLGYADPYRP